MIPIDNAVDYATKINNNGSIGLDIKIVITDAAV